MFTLKKKFFLKGGRAGQESQFQTFKKRTHTHKTLFSDALKGQCALGRYGWFKIWTNILTTMFTQPQENSPRFLVSPQQNYLGHWTMCLLRHLWNLFPGITRARPDHCCHVQLPILWPTEMTSAQNQCRRKREMCPLKHQTEQSLTPRKPSKWFQTTSNV